MRKLAESAYATHLRFAPSAAREAWKVYVDSVTRRDLNSMKEAQEQAEVSARESLSELCSALKSVSPSAALELLWGEHNDRLDEYLIPKGGETFSLAQGAWLIGVFACGEDSSKYGAHKVFNKYVRWAASYLIKLHINDLLIEDEVDRNIARVTSQLEISRFVEPETRMMWITDEIALQIGRWVDASIDQIDSRTTPSFATVEQISENISRATNNLNDAYRNKYRVIPESFSATLLDGVPVEMIDALTAPHRQVTETDVENALKSDAMTTTPFVRVEGTTRVLGRSAWLMKRDDALFRLVMQASPRDKEGKVFEDVTASLLQAWGPSDISWQSSVDLPSPGMPKTADDIDVLGFSDDVAFIGECKANRLPEKNSSVGSTLETVVLNKAISQLEKRVDHWRSGWRPQLADHFFPDDVMGFAVTFSSYGGMLWNPDRLHRDDSSVQYGVFPLYSLVLAVSMLVRPSDLRRYLSFRLNAMVNGVTNSDELEHLLGFVSASNSPGVTLDSEAKGLLRQYELSDQGVLIDPRKYRRDANWKHQFLSELWEHTTPVTPSLN